jgi:hypothetical protein
MEVKDLLEVLGIDQSEDLTIDKVKETVKEKFIPVALVTESEQFENAVNSAVGRKIGTFDTAVKRAFKNTLEDIDPSVFKDKKLEEYPQAIEDALKGYAEANKTKTDPKLNEQLTGLKSQLEEIEKMKEAAIQERDKVASEFTNYKTDLTKKQAFNEVLKSVPFSDGASELAKKGFMLELGEKYEYRLPEEGENTPDGIVFIDKSTGKRPVNGTDFMKGSEIITKLASEHDLIKKVDRSQKPSTVTTKIEDGEPTTAKPQYASKADQHLERLKQQSA